MTKKYCRNSRILVLNVLLLLLGACSSQPQLPKLSPDATILAFGDSLTYGSGAGRDEGYPEVLARLTGFEVINGGVPGELSGDGLKRLPALLDEHLPELLILCHGGNDMLHKENLDQTADNLRQMIRRAHERGVSVLMLAVPRPGLLLTPPDFYEEVTEEMKIPIDADLLSDLLANRSLKADTIHPNSKGYQKMAEAVFVLMQESGLIR